MVHFHPPAIHISVGLTVMAYILLALWIIKPGKFPGEMTFWTAILGFAGTGLAVITGNLDETWVRGGQELSEILRSHETSG